MSSANIAEPKLKLVDQAHHANKRGKGKQMRLILKVMYLSKELRLE